VDRFGWPRLNVGLARTVDVDRLAPSSPEEEPPVQIVTVRTFRTPKVQKICSSLAGKIVRHARSSGL
jgi:hypothetical protein